MAVAAPNDVSVVFETGPSGTVALLAGFASDLDITEMMYQSLHQQAAARMAEIRRGTPAATQRFRRSFLFGFADRLRTVLRESNEHLEHRSSPDQRSTAAIALRQRADMVDDFLRAQIGRVTTARPASSIQANGFQAGAAAANTADVGRSRLGSRAAIGAGR
jgi:hypothetical protein